MATLAERFPAFGLRASQLGGGLMNALASGGQLGGVSGLGNGRLDTGLNLSGLGVGNETGTDGNSDLARAAAAIARIESAGSGDYSAIGPTHPRYGRALGRYQVMESNIGPWALAAGLGRVTADEFLNRPDLQDAIFRHRFGLYMNRYGPEGAAAAWFAGPGNMGNMGARDALGTTVGNYVDRFMRGFY